LRLSMSLEITSAPPIPPIAPSQAAASPVHGESGAKTNPFTSLLAGLDAVQPPQISAVTETQVPSTTKPLMMQQPMAGELTPENNVATIDVLKAFMGPAFNSRHAVAQTEDLAKAAPAAATINTTSPVPAETVSSLLNLLASKTQASMAQAAAPGEVADAVIEQIVVEELQTLPAEIMQANVSKTLVETILPDNSQEQDADDEPAEPVSIGTANIILPTLIEAKPTIAIEATSPAGNTDTAAIGSDNHIPLFDRLSNSARETADVPTDSKSEVAAVEALVADVATPASSADINTPTQKPADIAQTAPPQPTAQNDSLPSPRNLPQVTMRPANEAQMVEGVSVLLARASKNQVNEFIIRMDPPELGRIEVQMKMSEDGTVQAVIASDNPNTHDLLRREASTIERALSESGFRTGNDGLSFNLKQHNSEPQRREPEKYASGSNNGSVAADDNIPTSVFTPLRQRYENARINISA
jgi:flagellar hook-length control protein FliK